MRMRWLWTLPLALAATIVWLSAQSHLPAGIELPSPLDKFAHASAYAALAWTLDLALRVNRRDLPLYRRHLFIIALVAFFGATDEWHQSFVPGRSCDVLDWVADVIGGGLGLFAASVHLVFSRRLEALSWRRGAGHRLDSARDLILVADPHWGAELTGLEEATARFPKADWLFLGDVFDVWVGLPGMETEAQRAFLAWVRERRQAGRWVGLWMGNREYFLDRHASAFDLMGEGIGGSLEGERLVWEHGDLINGADHQYRLWNLLSRSGLLWLPFCLMPGSTARKISAWMERKLHTTNAAYKLAFPREAFRAAAQAHSEATFLTGHFHTHEVEANGIALPWAHEGRFMVWRGGKVEPL
ncbi:VanZ family protein [Geothrix sp. PMB-07]|uniref:VanZ family protein n=1 Tax=Geothrix sp. PMB-07 TaxID=3068640 RepID=UPI0027415C20|nr:VanZ family protein [Geothrix sp. PMB-07]WLT31152.1 VanZ family protein [Geothrix sp. PMB-07]